MSNTTTPTVLTDTVDETTPEILTVEEIVTELVGTLPTDDNTAYTVWKVLTGALKALEIEKTVPSQMMYNYTRTGMIAKGKKGSAKEIRYSKDEVQAFVTKYVNKHSK